MHPNYEGMAVTEKQVAKDEYETKRKAFTDQKRAKQLKEAALNTETVQSYTGCPHPTLRTMTEVEKSRLEVGHTFPDKELLNLRVAEGATHRGISFMYHAVKCDNTKRMVKCLQLKPTTMK